MARSRWKLNYFSKSIWRKINWLKKGKSLKKRKICYDRSSTIPNVFCHSTLKVHKGRRYRTLSISRQMVGSKLGEFSFTRKPFYYPFRKKKKKNKNSLIRR